VFCVSIYFQALPDADFRNVAETERMRNVLRRREQDIKDADDRAFMHEAETQKVCISHLPLIPT
jgi:hypothetical protein